MTTVAFVVYKGCSLAEDRFVLHSFSRLQNNQLALLSIFVHRGDSGIESLVLFAKRAIPRSQFGFYNP